MNESATHVYFFGSQYSQWCASSIIEGDITFNCAEQYMMYWKALAFGDLKSRDAILAASEPWEQKALGRKVRGFNDTRWDLIKEQVVYQANYLKFTQNLDMKKVLLENHKGKIFVEASPTDVVWGIGLALESPLIYDEKNWRGTNLLGKAINKVQEVLLKKAHV